MVKSTRESRPRVQHRSPLLHRRLPITWVVYLAQTPILRHIDEQSHQVWATRHVFNGITVVFFSFLMGFRQCLVHICRPTSKYYHRKAIVDGTSTVPLFANEYPTCLFRSLFRCYVVPDTRSPKKSDTFEPPSTPPLYCTVAGPAATVGY